MSSHESSTPQVPNASIPKTGFSADRVGALLQKHMAADTPPSRDLGRFSTTSFDETAMDLMVTATIRSQPCIEEYPSIAEFGEKCVSILANLWHAPNDFFGAATTGSSEAVLLGGLTMKRQWQLKYPERASSRPNVLIGANAHICVHKFADYFDVEARIIPVSEESRYSFDVKGLGDHLDENTIGVFLTLGSTYTGHYDPVQQVARLLDNYEHKTGHNIPIHVDAASGGFIAPFTPSNANFIWDFRLPRVQSINVSGHKFGMAPLAVGWIVWREKSLIPQGLLLESSYLRGTHSNFSLSFSRSGAPIAGQYYNFLRFGLDGYRERTSHLLEFAYRFSIRLEDTGYFVCLSGAHRQPLAHRAGNRYTFCCGADQAAAPVLPIVVFTLTGHARQQYPKLQLSDVSNAMQDSKLSIPNYTVPVSRFNGEKIEVMRIVLRDEMTDELMEEVLTCITQAVDKLIHNA